MTEGMDREAVRAGTAWSDTENTQLVDGVRRGWPVRQLAAAHGRTDKAVTKQVESMIPAELGLRGGMAVGWLRARLDTDPAYDWREPLRDRRVNYWSADEDEELRTAWEGGLDMPMVAERLGKPELVVHNRLVKLGLSKDEVETVQRMGTAAGSVLEVRSRRQRGEPLHLGTTLIVSGPLTEDGTNFHASMHWSREAGLAELQKVKRKNRELANSRGVMPGDGPWLLMVRMFGAGGKLVAGPDLTGTLSDTSDISDISEGSA